MEIGQDEEAWCKVRNESFAKLQGNETPAIRLSREKGYSRTVICVNEEGIN